MDLEVNAVDSGLTRYDACNYLLRRALQQPDRKVHLVSKQYAWKSPETLQVQAHKKFRGHLYIPFDQLSTASLEGLPDHYMDLNSMYSWIDVSFWSKTPQQTLKSFHDLLLSSFGQCVSIIFGLLQSKWLFVCFFATPTTTSVLPTQSFIRLPIRFLSETCLGRSLFL